MKLASLLLMLLLSAPKPAVPAKKGAGGFGIPKLAPGQLWVSSVPVGLEVHAGDTPVPKKVLGRTPLVLNPRDIERYVTVTIQTKEFGRALPNLMQFVDFTARATHSNVWRGTNDQGLTVEEDRSRAITYDVVLPRKQTIIALFQTQDLSPSDLDRLYPPGFNFPFSDRDLQKRLARKGVPTEYISSGVRLLHRGGKIALPGAQGWGGPVIAELTSGGRVDLLDRTGTPAK